MNNDISIKKEELPKLPDNWEWATREEYYWSSSIGLQNPIYKYWVALNPKEGAFVAIRIRNGCFYTNNIENIPATEIARVLQLVVNVNQ
jgi:hypothetical protein